MVKYEYKTLDIPIERGFMSGILNSPLPDLEKILNAEGTDGWRLAQLLPPEVASGWGLSADKMVALLERQIV